MIMYLHVDGIYTYMHVGGILCLVIIPYSLVVKRLWLLSAHSLLGAGFYAVFTTGLFSACAKQTVQYSVAVVL